MKASEKNMNERTDENRNERAPAGGAGNTSAADGRPAKRRKVREQILRYIVITLGCFCLGAGIALFLDPNKLAPGGISGVAINLFPKFRRGCGCCF